MFAKIHEKQQTPKLEAQLRQIFIDNGVDAKKFDAAYNGVHQLTQCKKRLISSLMRAH